MTARLVCPFDRPKPRMDCLFGRIEMDGREIGVKEAAIHVARWEAKLIGYPNERETRLLKDAINDATAAIAAALNEADHLTAKHREFARLANAWRR